MTGKRFVKVWQRGAVNVVGRGGGKLNAAKSSQLFVKIDLHSVNFLRASIYIF